MNRRKCSSSMYNEIIDWNRRKANHKKKPKIKLPEIRKLKMFSVPGLPHSLFLFFRRKLMRKNNIFKHMAIHKSEKTYSGIYIAHMTEQKIKNLTQVEWFFLTFCCQYHVSIPLLFIVYIIFFVFVLSIFHSQQREFDLSIYDCFSFRSTNKSNTRQ